MSTSKNKFGKSRSTPKSNLLSENLKRRMNRLGHVCRSQSIDKISIVYARMET